MRRVVFLKPVITTTMMAVILSAAALSSVACEKSSGLLPADTGAPQKTAPEKTELPQGHPAVAGSDALPPGHPPADEHGTVSPNGDSISGVIDIDPALASQVKAGDTIFVIARNGTTGQMMGVARLMAPEKFPAPFSISGNSPMAPGPLTGSIRLSARVDKDGDATSKNPGDVVGEHPELVPVPSKDVKLMLTKVL